MRNGNKYNIKLTGGPGNDTGNSHDNRFQDDFGREASEGLSKNPGWKKDIREVKGILRKKWGIPIIPIYARISMYSLATAVCLVFVFIISEKWYGIKDQLADRMLADETTVQTPPVMMDSLKSAVPDKHVFTETQVVDNVSANRQFAGDGVVDQTVAKVTLDEESAKAKDKSEKEVTTLADVQTKTEQDALERYEPATSEDRKANKKAETTVSTGSVSFAEKNEEEKADLNYRKDGDEGLINTVVMAQEMSGAARAISDDNNVSLLAGMTRFPQDVMYDLIVVDYSRLRTQTSFDNNITDIASVEPKYENQDSRNKESAAPAEALKKEEKIAYVNFLDNAMKKFKSPYYSAALADYEIILQQYPDDLNALFYGGLCNYHLKKYDKAITNLDQVINNSVDLFFEEAEWYKALSLINASKKDEAKALLEKIEKTGGFYKKDAEKKLKGLK